MQEKTSSGNQGIHETINKMAKDQSLTLNEQGLLEVDPAKLTELINAAAHAGSRLEILGMKNGKAVLRSGRVRYEHFEKDASGQITANKLGGKMMVMLD